MRLESTLEEFGLNKNKATVYLAAMQVGRGRVLDIAHKVVLPRTTVHEILQQLCAMGLVSFTTRGRTRIYTVEKPTQLQRILMEKQKHLEAALPQLMSLYNTTGTRPQIRVYEGVTGVKTVFEDTLTVRDKVLRGILSMEDLFEIPGRAYMQDYVNRRVAAGITLKVIRSEQKEVEETWPSSRAEQRELRYAVAGFIFPMTVYLYDNKVSIMGTKKENFGMIIESADFHQTLRNLFEVLWSVSKVAKSIND